MKLETLRSIINKLETYDQEDGVIYAVEPWKPDSVAFIVNYPEGCDPPPKIAELGAKYFMEVFIARDFIEDWLKGGDSEEGFRDVYDRIIYYAIYDA